MLLHSLIGRMIRQVLAVVSHKFTGRITEDAGERLAQVLEHSLRVVHVDEMRPLEVLDQPPEPLLALPQRLLGLLARVTSRSMPVYPRKDPSSANTGMPLVSTVTRRPSFRTSVFSSSSRGFLAS